MVNQQLVNYIKAQEARGYSAQQLRNYLMQKGYNQAEVDGAIRYAGAGNTYPSQQPQQLAKQGKFGFFQKIISVIKKPKEFYNRIKAEPGIKKALIFYILLVTLALVLQIPLTIIIAFIKNKTIGTFTLLSSLFLLIAIPIALIITIPLLFIMWVISYIS